MVGVRVCVRAAALLLLPLRLRCCIGVAGVLVRSGNGGVSIWVLCVCLHMLATSRRQTMLSKRPRAQGTRQQYCAHNWIAATWC